jgi:hypothetical protein
LNQSPIVTPEAARERDPGAENSAKELGPRFRGDERNLLALTFWSGPRYWPARHHSAPVIEDWQKIGSPAASDQRARRAASTDKGRQR